jgi:hypothetical protein
VRRFVCRASSWGDHRIAGVLSCARAELDAACQTSPLAPATIETGSVRVARQIMAGSAWPFYIKDWPHIVLNGLETLNRTNWPVCTLISDGLARRTRIPWRRWTCCTRPDVVVSTERWLERTGRIYRGGRMRSAHTPATMRSEKRRVGDGFRERLRISNCWLDEHGFGDHGARAARTGQAGDCRQADAETGRPDRAPHNPSKIANSKTRSRICNSPCTCDSLPCRGNHTKPPFEAGESLSPYPLPRHELKDGEGWIRTSAGC